MASLPDPLVSTDRIEAVWADIDHAEGLAVAPDATVWCGGEAGQVYAGRLDGEPRQVATLPGRTLGFCLDAARNAYCADMDRPGVYRIVPNGDLRLLAHEPLRFVLNQPTNIAFVPGTRRLVAANIGERFLSALEPETLGAEIVRPESPWQPKEGGA